MIWMIHQKKANFGRKTSSLTPLPLAKTWLLQFLQQSNISVIQNFKASFFFLVHLFFPLRAIPFFYSSPLLHFVMKVDKWQVDLFVKV
jgi:hypothetical protein